MTDERTLATEVREFFQSLVRGTNRHINTAIAQTVETNVGSMQFYSVLVTVKSNCDQLIADINSSRLKSGSKALYAGAVATLANYLSLDGLLESTTDGLKGEVKAFEYLTLVDDFLEPLDNREIPTDFLSKISEQARVMLEELDESEVDNRLKVFLGRQIRQFMWSIQTFEIVGIEGLTRAWGAMAAEIARSQGMQQATKPAAKAWYKRAIPTIGVIGLAVTSVSATVEKADNLLTHGSHIAQVLIGHDADKTEDGTASTITEVAPE
jgi:hypothetical protein